MSNLPLGNRAQSVMSGHVADYDDTISTSSKNDCSSNPFNMLGSDSGMEQKTGSTTSSDYFEMASYKDAATSPLREGGELAVSSQTSLPQFITQEQLLVPADFMTSEYAIFEGYEWRRTSISSDEQTICVPEWHLFAGRSFELGESIFANFFLPIGEVVLRSEVPRML
ncbi:hypothetical protein KIN20_036900 [Parelaphostrongylus tenuis]|uniref:Uncharacterized protein n=1 Tax=Parelaphostrongylus tenuis TaxID=148309 RepID=A0AAD5RDU3_PARTN|nr:hypothetical protein KIN20_036900 [Parelaphostrongylus tenuis]